MGYGLTATRLVKKMRGGSQSHLFEVQNGNHYVVKFKNNPQHRRILVNEWIAAGILKHLDISTPIVNKVLVPESFLRENSNICIQLAFKQIRPEEGEHFGSFYRTKKAVYDFVPDRLMHKIGNLDHFLGVLVVDKWLANTDSRQAVYYHRNGKYFAEMIDNGYIFAGGEWKFVDSPLYGLYSRPQVYASVRSIDDFQPWLEKVQNFPEVELYRIMKSIPQPWIDGDEADLIAVIDKVISRREKVESLIGAMRKHLFLNWT